jgi:hypothetical protein
LYGSIIYPSSFTLILLLENRSIFFETKKKQKYLTNDLHIIEVSLRKNAQMNKSFKVIEWE